MNKLFANKWVQILSLASIAIVIILGFWLLRSTPKTMQKQASTVPERSQNAGGEFANAAPSAPTSEMSTVDFSVTALTAKNIAPKPLSPLLEAANLLKNPGFENGLEPWEWLTWSKGWSGFEHSSNVAYEGAHSLLLPVLSKDSRPTVVWGAVQELSLLEEIPDCVDGYFYVEEWVKGDWKQYLQLVLIDLSQDLGPNKGQAQLRYIISGEKSAPLSISNAQYLFIENERREHPLIGEWVQFSVNPREDFLKHWQYTPQSGHKIRILFEARFDAHRPDQLQAKAKVYFDNLYMGPKTETRCN